MLLAGFGFKRQLVTIGDGPERPGLAGFESELSIQVEAGEYFSVFDHKRNGLALILEKNSCIKDRGPTGYTTCFFTL
jgi:hypothetical protein